MTPISVTQTGVGDSSPINVDNFTNPYNVGFHYVVTGTATFDIQITPQDMADATPTVWAAPSGFTGLTASGVQGSIIPARGVRIHQTAGTGSVTLYVVQAGLR